MADAGAIQDASETLATLLEANVETELPDTSLTVELTSPDATSGSSNPTLSLYLFRVTEDEHLSRVDRREMDATTLEQEPLVLELNYLLTVYPSGNGGETKQIKTQQRLLGKAMRVLRENAIVRGSDLKGSLTEELRITRTETDESVVDIWNTFPNTAYLPSVTYAVGPVSIEPTETEPAGRVTSVSVGEDDD